MVVSIMISLTNPAWTCRKMGTTFRPVTVPMQFDQERQRFKCNAWHAMNRTLFENMPKVELHLHLEGAIPHGAIWELASKYGESARIGSVSSLRQKLRFKDFPSFLKTFIWTTSFLREYDDFTFVASKVAEDLVLQNIQYVEAFYSFGTIDRQELDAQRVTESIRKGLEIHSDEIETKLVADLVRDYGPEQGWVWLQEIKDLSDLGVIGIGIGGSEHEFPPEPYKHIYDRARDFGLRTSAHAGEAAGPESIWGAVRTLKADRIGHGTRAIEDPDLVEYLSEEKIPIELCPLSNIKTGIVADISSHPVRQYFDSGLLVTINTDDPKLFNSSLAEEYSLLHEEMGFSLADIRTLSLNGIEAAWCDDSEKLRLRTAFEEELTANGF